VADSGWRTDFYPALGERLPRERVVDITALREIRGITTESEHVPHWWA